MKISRELFELDAIDLDARAAVLGAVAEASELFQAEPGLTAAERRAVMNGKLAEARAELNCYIASDADQAFSAAVDRVLSGVTS